MIDFPDLKRHLTNRQFGRQIMIPIVTFIITEFIFIFWHLAATQLNQGTFYLWNTIKESALTSLILALIMQLYLTMRSLYSWKNEIAQAFYGGFYKLLSNRNTQKQFEKLESSFSESTHLTPPLRTLLSEFVMASLASIGENGFAIVNAKVETYVEFISRVLTASSEAVIVCVVRPNWFVTNRIQDVTTIPHPIPKGEKFTYGKGSHLGIKPTAKQKFQRWLIIDELVLAEMLFTAYFDKYMVGVSEMDCPVCKECLNDGAECPFHAASMRLPYGPIKDIPELHWFQIQAHKGREKNTSLVFIPERHELKKSRLEFTDRVFVKTNDLDIAVIFSFTNLERGNLQIYWGDQSANFRAGRVQNFESKVNLQSGEPSELGIRHLFYDDFRKLLEDVNDYRDRMIVHIELLKAQVESYFTENVASITGDRSSFTKSYLAKGNQSMKSNITKTCDNLKLDLQNEDLNLKAIYNKLLGFYNDEGGKIRVPKVAYILTLDSAHPKCPARVAEWHYYWEEIKSNQVTL